MVIKIGIIGGPSVGKSIQCAHFFAIAKSKNVQIEQIQEWVREAFNNEMIPEDNPWVQFWVYEEQKRREDCVPKEIEYIVTDSPTVLSYIYALHNGRVEKDKWLFVKMYEKFITDMNRYDYIFLCEREKPYVKDGTRKETEEEAKRIDMQIKNLFDIHRFKYHILRGCTEDRTNKMCDIIGI